MAKTAILKPKYTHLNFDTKDGLEAWLKTVRHKVITFEDHGQDLRTIVVDKEGEIVICDLQSKIWCGRYINMDELTVGENIQMQDKIGGHWNTMKFIIEKVEDCEA